MPAGVPRRNLAARLPNELLLTCLGYLRQPALLQAARVSQHWRAMAKALPNFYRFHSFELCYPDWPNRDRTVVDSSIAVLESVVDDADRSGYNLSLRLYIDADEYDPGYETDEDNPSASAGESRPLGHAVASLVCRATPRLVTLSVIAIAPYIDILFEALRIPAPSLHTFRAALTGIHHRDPQRQLQLPENLFRGNAPRLTVLCFGDIGPMPSTVSFPSARELVLYHANEAHTLADVYDHDCYPNIRNLVIEHLPRTEPLLTGDVGIFSPLSSLVLGPEVDLRLFLPAFDIIRGISIIEFTNSQSLSYTRKLMPRRDNATTEPLHLLLAEHTRPSSRSRNGANHPRATARVSQLRAVLTFGVPPDDAESGTRRIVDCDIIHSETMNYLASFSIASKLTAVEIDDRHVCALIRTLGPLPRLVSLAVVLLEWARAPAHHYASDADSEPVCACGRDSSSCTGDCDYFAQEFGGSWAALATLDAPLPALHTLALRPTHVDSLIGADVLQVLAQLCPHRLLHLELWHGLSVAGSDLPAFASVSSFGILEPPSDTIARVTTLIDQDSSQKAGVHKAALGRCKRWLSEHSWMH